MTDLLVVSEEDEDLLDLEDCILKAAQAGSQFLLPRSREVQKVYSLDAADTDTSDGEDIDGAANWMIASTDVEWEVDPDGELEQSLQFSLRHDRPGAMMVERDELESTMEDGGLEPAHASQPHVLLLSSDSAQDSVGASKIVREESTVALADVSHAACAGVPPSARKREQPRSMPEAELLIGENTAGSLTGAGPPRTESKTADGWHVEEERKENERLDGFHARGAQTWQPTSSSLRSEQSGGLEASSTSAPGGPALEQLCQTSSAFSSLALGVTLREGKTIGMGSFGRVFTAQHQHSGALLAVKEMILKKSGTTSIKILARELDFCKSLRHPNIVPYLGHEFNGQRLCIFLEYCGGGSVASQLETFGPLHHSLLSHHTVQLLRGVHFLHSRTPPVVHRDLKCANILITHDGSIKLGDFGCAKQLVQGEGMPGCEHSIAGSVFWMAPEVLATGCKLTVAADIWSTGCCVLEMALARPPWSEEKLDNIFAAYRKIVEPESLPKVPEDLDEDIRSFVHTCVVRAVEERPTAWDLMTHRLCESHSSPRRARGELSPA